MNLKHLRAIAILAFALLTCALAIQAKTRQGEKYYKQGQAAELKNDWDTAVTMYQKAMDDNPGDLAYQIAVRRSRFQAGQKHVEAGVKLRTADKLSEAIQEFQKALVIDPSSAVAIQELKRTQEMVLIRNNQGAATPGNAGLTPVEIVKKETDARIASIEAPPELKPGLPRLPSPMKMNQQTPQALFRTVAMMAGLYVDFDPQYQPPSNKPLDANLDGMTVEQAFDYLAFITHTFWKPISSNTIFVCEDNTTKRRDYEDEVVKVFYVPNAYTVQEFQEIANGIRTVTEIRRLFTYNAGRAMMVRGTADQVALVEKLVHDLDKPKAEVIVDIMIMQANTTRSKQLAATIATGGTAGLNVPISFTPRSSISLGGTGSTTTTSSTTSGATTTPLGSTGSTVGTTTSVGLNSLSHIASADFSTSLPGALLEAMLTDTKTKVLNSPQVRASDGMKVELQVGLRIPYATGSLGSAVGATTVGVSPLVQTQFSYADTGVTVVIQPVVHSAEELTMHVEITVSSVQQYENLGGGISQPVISQEKNITDVRMRNNEVSLLGGLNQSTDSSTNNGIPGLSSIPVLGKFLFGSTSTEKDTDQLMIAMIPHIVRTPDYTPENLRGIFAGSDQNVKIIHAPPAEVAVSAPAPAATVPPAAAAPAVVVPPAAAPGGVPAPGPPIIPPPAQVGPAQGLPTPLPPGVIPISPGAAPPLAVPQAPVPVPIDPAKPIDPTKPVDPAKPVAAAPDGTKPEPVKIAAEPTTPAAGRLSFVQGPVKVAKNGSFTLTMQLDGASDVSSVAPLHIKFDPARVHLDDVSAGDLFTREGGGQVATNWDIRNDAGEATLTLKRPPGASGVWGSGPVATLNFSAVKKGTGTIAITSASVRSSLAQELPVLLGSVPVTVQ